MRLLPRESKCITSVTIVDVERGSLLRDRMVLVEGDGIKRICQNNESSTPEGSPAIDGRGLYLIPGLVDAHIARATEREVDKIYAEYLDTLTKAPSAANLVCSLLFVRYLERIADHATYIGESIVYIATGEKVSLR